MSRALEIREIEWEDKFGSHWEARRTLPNGRVASIKLTRDPLTGWPNRDNARAKLIAGKTTHD